MKKGSTITRSSRLKDVLSSPAGHDIIARLLYSLGIDEKAVSRGPIGNLSIGSLPKISFGKFDQAFLDALLTLLNSQAEYPEETPAKKEKKWWKEAVVYQVYPRSFRDSNGDGIGDIPGIIEKLDYLKDLGVGAIWLGPVFDSPNDDNGYDVRDYRKIQQEFGTMEDMDSLIREVHRRGMKLLIDLVLNHTSDEHAWFRKALEDPSSPCRDYYFFRRGGEKQIPNNWDSLFSGPAWRRFPEQEAWALHLFTKKQMDLNWDNPAVRRELAQIACWWLDKGVDGFRLDVISFISKDEGLPDGNPVIGQLMGFTGVEHYFHGPHLDQYLQQFRRESFGKYDSYTVGECAGNGIMLSRLLTGDDRGELDTVFNFDHCENPKRKRFDLYTFDLRPMARELLRWQTEYSPHCWPTVFFENHDLPRMTSKACPDGFCRKELAKLLATMEFTLRGTPYIYQGQELGMENCPFPSLGDFRDVETLNKYSELLGKGMSPRRAFRHILCGSRDNARTPMQWDDTRMAGFTDGPSSWIMVNPDHRDINVETEDGDPDSVLSYYRRMIRLRRGSDALIYGDFFVGNSSRDVLVYERKGEDGRYVVELNLTPRFQKRTISLERLERILGNYEKTGQILHPFEANVYKVR